MNRKFKIFLSLSALCLSVAMLCFGVYSALQVSYSVGGSVSYEIQDVFVNIKMNVYRANVEAPIKSDAHNTNITTIENAGNNIAEKGFTQLTGGNYTDTQTSYKDNSATQPQEGDTLPLESNEIALTFGAPSQNQGYAFYIVIDIQNQADDTINARITKETSPENTIFASSQDIELSALETGRIVLGLSLDDVTVGMKDSPFSYTITISRGELPIDLTGMTFSFDEQTATLIDYKGTASKVRIPASVGTIDVTEKTLEFTSIDEMMASLGGALSYSDYYSFAKISYKEDGVAVPSYPEKEPEPELVILFVEKFQDPSAITDITIEFLKEYTLTSEYLQGVLTKYGDMGVEIASLCLYGPAYMSEMSGGSLLYDGSYEISVEEDGSKKTFTIDSAAVQDYLTNGEKGTGDYAEYYRDYNYILEVVGETEPDYTKIPDITFNITSFGKQPVKGDTYKVTTIGSQVFRDCVSLTTITIPESVTSIGNAAFSGCTSLTDITIPEGVTSIGSSAFSGCTSLTDITIPEGVTSIGNYAFDSCSSLTDITIPEGVTSIGSSAFSGCSSLTTITIPEGVTSIGDDAFTGCDSLTTITIPESVISIGEYAFYNCSNLTTITIPKRVTSIGSNAFWNCHALAEVYNYSEHITVEIRESSNGSLGYYAKVVYNLKGSENPDEKPDSKIQPIGNVQYYVDKEKGEFIALAPSVARDSLTELTLHPETTAINRSAFSDCRSLTTITIPASVTSIGSYAFLFCYALAEVYNYSEHITVEIGESSNGSLGYYAKVVYNLKNSENPGEKPDSKIQPIGNVQYYVDKEKGEFIALAPSVARYSLTELTLDSRTTEIYGYAFEYCSNLTTITIPESVTSIGGHAFYGTQWLTNLVKDSYGIATASDGETKFVIDVPTSITDEELEQLDLSNVKVIAEFAFSGCSNLTTITIPESVTSIGGSTFSGCSSLTNITIPEGVTSIGGSAFQYCYSLESVYINGQDVVDMLDGTGDNDAGGLLSYISSGEKVYINSELTITGYMEDNFTPQGEETVGGITYNVYVKD